MENLARKKEVEEYGLTPRERRFADEYIANGRNATQAYKKISPKAKDTTCATKGLGMVRKQSVSDYIKMKTKERLDASSLRADNILDELIAIGFGQTQTGKNKQIDNVTGEVKKDLTYEMTAVTEDRLKALELLGKNLAMWTDKTEINANIAPVTIVDDIGVMDDDD